MTFVIVIAVTAAAFAAGMLFPGLRELETRRAAIAAELDQAQQAQAEVSDMSAMYAGIIKLKEREYQLWNQIPVEPRFSEFLNQLSQELKATGINEYDVQRPPARELDPTRLPESLRLAAHIVVLPVALKFECDANQMQRLLDRIEGVERLVHVDDLKIQNDEKSPGRLSVELVLQVYHRRRT